MSTDTLVIIAQALVIAMIPVFIGCCAITYVAYREKELEKEKHWQ